MHPHTYSRTHGDKPVDESEEALFPERLIEADTLRPTSDGFVTGVRLPWYRALPLSCVERMEVVVDNEPIPKDDVTLTLAERGPYKLADLAELIDTYWYVLDSAELSVKTPTALTPGKHDVTVNFGLYIPYLPVNGAPLVNLDSCSATLEVSA